MNHVDVINDRDDILGIAPVAGPIFIGVDVSAAVEKNDAVLDLDLRILEQARDLQISISRV